MADRRRAADALPLKQIRARTTSGRSVIDGQRRERCLSRMSFVICSHASLAIHDSCLCTLSTVYLVVHHGLSGSDLTSLLMGSLDLQSDRIQTSGSSLYRVGTEHALHRLPRAKIYSRTALSSGCYRKYVGAYRILDGVDRYCTYLLSNVVSLTLDVCEVSPFSST